MLRHTTADCGSAMDGAGRRVNVVAMKTTDRAATARSPRRIEHLKSYGPLLRLCDRIAGWSDRRIVDTVSSTGDNVHTPYVARLQATYDEIDRHTFARTQDACRQPATKLRELITDLRRLDLLIVDAEAALAGVSSQPDADALRFRNGGELHLDDHAVGIRRGREHASRISQQNAALTKLKDQRNQYLIACASHAAQLVEAFELGRSTSGRLRHFYNRRLASYARHARIPGTCFATITVPDWTTGPCPWLPAGYDAAMGAALPEHHAITAGSR